MAEEKQNNINDIINKVTERDHFICYCGDGKLYDDRGLEKRHIQFIKRKLDEQGYRPAQFTASENMMRRMDIIERFDSENLTALVAIRCLDEGIDIPSIKSALILSSNDNMREFVQRRGRILRKHKNKKEAKIYDVIVLPSANMQAMAKIEFRRFYEYARLAVNSEDLLEQLKNMMIQYNLTLEEITTVVETDMEELDE